jgi:hypothetical protein
MVKRRSRASKKRYSKKRYSKKRYSKKRYSKNKRGGMPVQGDTAPVPAPKPPNAAQLAAIKQYGADRAQYLAKQAAQAEHARRLVKEPGYASKVLWQAELKRQERERQAQKATAATLIQAHHRGQAARGTRDSSVLSAAARQRRFETLSTTAQSLGIDEALKRDDAFQLNKSAKAQAEMARRETAAALRAEEWDGWLSPEQRAEWGSGELAATGIMRTDKERNWKSTEGDYGSVQSGTAGWNLSEL